MTRKFIKRKLLLLGDEAVGKTSLIRRFVVDKFDDKYIATIGTKVTKKDLIIKGEGREILLTMLIWDVLGQKGYTKVQESSFIGTHGTILVCDFTRKETLESLRTYWMPLIKKLGSDIPIVFVANKADLKEKSQFSFNEVKSIAATQESQSFKASAKTGANVEEIFKAVGQEVIRSFVGPSTHVPLQIESPTERMTPVEATDHIINDFCRGYGGMEDGMPVIRTQFRRAGVDIKNPTKEGLEKVIVYLAEVEREFKDKATVNSNLVKRRKWIGKIKS
jgi:small GTP-binding protein